MTLGPSILMPSIKLDLGKYVTLRARKNGTHRIFFQVPARLRPPGWLSLIPLPIEAPRTGNLSDAQEVRRVRTDAAGLYAKLLAERRLIATPIVETRSIPELNRLWQVTQGFKKTRPRTQRNYANAAALIEAWSASVHHPPVAAMRSDKVEAFLAIYDDRPSTKKQILTVLRLMMAYAVRLGWRTDNPTEGIRISIPMFPVAIWEAEDVELYAAAFTSAGRSSISAMIRTQWEIGQRMTDVRLFRYDAEYTEGVFRFKQSKTDSPVSIPISDQLASRLLLCRQAETPHLFVDEDTGHPWREIDLSRTFAYVRDQCILPSGGPHRVLRVLRHSCVVQMARAGCEIPEIAAVTGHSLSSVTKILSHYLPRDDQVARNAQIKRGLIQRMPA